MISGLVLTTLLAVPLAEPIEVFKGERIAVLGNTLADRMQHTGHLEARLQARFPDHGIMLRHMGFSGDELKLRLRSRKSSSRLPMARRCSPGVRKSYSKLMLCCWIG